MPFKHYGEGTWSILRSPTTFVRSFKAWRVWHAWHVWASGRTLGRAWTSYARGTVSASNSGSFDIGHGVFTPPARPLLTPAATQTRLGAAPR
eukprot:6138881-Prymnesium_polylepis.1